MPEDGGQNSELEGEKSPTTPSCTHIPRDVGLALSGYEEWRRNKPDVLAQKGRWRWQREG